MIIPKKDRQWFIDRVVIAESGCWVWVGEKSPRGYAYTTYQEGGVKKKFRVHRMAYDSLVGQIPDGLLVCHHCDNPPCVNPEHLFVGTNLDNVRDRDKKGRHHGRGLGESGIFGVIRKSSRWTALVKQKTFGGYKTKIAAAYRVHVEQIAGSGEEKG